jgi:hypothetical protein
MPSQQPGCRPGRHFAAALPEHLTESEWRMSNKKRPPADCLDSLALAYEDALACIRTVSSLLTAVKIFRRAAQAAARNEPIGTSGPNAGRVASWTSRGKGSVVKALHALHQAVLSGRKTIPPLATELINAANGKRARAGLIIRCSAHEAALALAENVFDHAWRKADPKGHYEAAAPGNDADPERFKLANVANCWFAVCLNHYDAYQFEEEGLRLACREEWARATAVRATADDRSRQMTAARPNHSRGYARQGAGGSNSPQSLPRGVGAPGHPRGPQFENWALGIEHGDVWQVFKRIGDQWRHQGRLRNLSAGRQAEMLKAIAEGGGFLSDHAATQLIRETYSDSDKTRIRNIIKPVLSQLRQLMRRVVSAADTQADPLPRDKHTHGWQTKIQVGYAIQDEKGKLMFKSREQLSSSEWLDAD